MASKGGGRGRSFVRFDQEGDWLRARDTFNRMASGEVIERAQEIIKDELDRAKDELISAILSGSLGLAPASMAWQQYEATHGLDPRTLISTGEYLDSFTVSRIGMRTWKLHPEGQEDLAQALEYGTKGTVARPHWMFINDKLPARLRSALQAEFKSMF